MGLNQEIFYFINHLPHNVILEGVFVFIRYFSFSFITVSILWLIRKEKLIYFFRTFIITISPWIATHIIKLIIQYPRPVDSLNNVIVSHWYFSSSFPSAETAMIFSLATVFTVLTKNKLFNYLVYVLAFLVGISRIYFGAHYPIDVIAGAILGIFIPRAIIRSKDMLSRQI